METAYTHSPPILSLLLGLRKVFILYTFYQLLKSPLPPTSYPNSPFRYGKWKICTMFTGTEFAPNMLFSEPVSSGYRGSGV